MTTRSLCLVVGLAASAIPALGQSFLMVVDSAATGRVMLFNPVDGSVVNANFIVEPVAGAFTLTTPKNAIQVNSEIWLSDQILDAVLRFDLAGNYLGTIGGGITGGMDNIRGLAFIGGTVYVSNGGAANGSPGANSVVLINPATNAISGNFVTSANSPFDVFPLNATEVLVSGSSNNVDVARHTQAGVLQGTWNNGTISFAQQITQRTNGEFLIAGFTDGQIHRYDAAGTDLGNLLPAPGSRGVFELQNGNIMWTAGSGVHVFTMPAGPDTVVLAASAQYIDLLTLPTTGCYANCDASSTAPVLTANDFQCFLNAFAAADSYANCDGSTTVPVLTANDFQCFLNAFAAGCS